MYDHRHNVSSGLWILEQQHYCGCSESDIRYPRGRIGGSIVLMVSVILSEQLDLIQAYNCCTSIIWNTFT